MASALLTRRWELMLAARYLSTRRRQAFITVITTISTLGVAVGVAALIIGLSLATGIHQEIRERGARKIIGRGEARPPSFGCRNA